MNTLERALQQLRAGHPKEAETIALEAASQAEQSHGAESPEHAAALFDQAQVLLGLGEPMRAAEAMRSAAAVPARDQSGRGRQLGYLNNLGELLQRLGKLEDAQRVLEESVAGRLALYGDGSEGLAYGQAMLADVLFWRGLLDRAEELVEEACGVLWHAHSGRVAAALALRAAIRAAKYGDERPLLEYLDPLPHELRLELIGLVLDRAQRDPPASTLLVLQELRERLEDEESLRPVLPQVVAAQANLARRGGDAGAAQEALGWLAAHFDAQKDSLQALRAWLNLGLARDASGDAAGAEAAYREALRRADDTGKDAVRAQANRAAAHYFSKRGLQDEADRLFAAALDCAERSGDPEQLGESLVARGAFLQHRARNDEARPLLERALRTFPEAHPGRVFARSHLEAIEKGGPCGCGQSGNALSALLEKLVRENLPVGLLKALKVDASAGFGVEIQLEREPSAEEREQLQRAIRQAIARLGSLPPGPAKA